MIPSSETAPSEELRKDPGTACPNVLAVDFGTATTYICKCPGDRLSPQGLLLRGDRDGVASVLLYRQDRDPLVGDEALEEFGEAPEAERRAYALRAQFKPDIARGNDAAEYARDFLAGLLREARRQHLDMEPEGREVLFGVPSEADDTFRATLTRIAREAGYGDIHTVDEPLGALVYHVFHQDLPARDALRGLLVVDFGGGTCDFAFLQRGHVVSSWGDMTLGGRLFDDLIYSWLLEQNPGLEEQLRTSGDEFFVQTHLCREIKETFSRSMARDRTRPFSRAARHYGRLDAMTWEAFLSRAQNFHPSMAFQDFQRHMTPSSTPESPDSMDLLERFRRCLLEGLRRENIHREDIRFVVLTGGSSQWPFVADMLGEDLGTEENRIMRSDRPNAAIAEGLALLPALRRTYRDARRALEDDFPRFRAQELEPLGQRRTATAAREVAETIARELFDGALLSRLRDFQQEGGSLGQLRRDLEGCTATFAPRHRDLVARLGQELLQELPEEMGNRAEDFFRRHGFRMAEDAGNLPAPAEGPPLATLDLLSTLTPPLEALVLALLTGAGALVSGGGGMALVSSGPLGLMVGAGMGFVAGWALLTQGRAWSRRMLEDLPLPPPVARALLGASRLEALREKFLADLARETESLFAPMAQELVHREEIRLQREAEALSELQRL